MPKTRERTLYRETYRKGVKLKSEALPVLNHYGTNGERFVPTECHLLAAGCVDRDGKEIQYQDLRVYFEVQPRG